MLDHLHTSVSCMQIRWRGLILVVNYPDKTFVKTVKKFAGNVDRMEIEIRVKCFRQKLKNALLYAVVEKNEGWSISKVLVFLLHSKLLAMAFWLEAAGYNAQLEEDRLIFTKQNNRGRTTISR